MKSLKLLPLLVSLATAPLMAEEEAPKLSFKATEVAPGLFMLMGEGGFAGGNIGLSVGDDGVVLIDDAMPTTLDIMNQAIKGVTERDIDFVINTHVHGDHTGNNSVMADAGAHIVAHENLRKHLQTKGMNGKAVAESMLPVITFTEAMTFHLNGVDARLIHTPKAHTDGDSVIHFEQLNVIHTGDNFFNGMFPFIDLNSGGSVDGYIAAQKKIHAMSQDDTKIIPGHGPLANKADLAKSIAMLEDARSLIMAAIKAGKSEDEVVEMNPLAEKYQSWHWGFITTERMTRQLYQGLK